ncbi:MAG: hypothetical protein V3U75_06995 [Methylococcaceae bacterium]
MKQIVSSSLLKGMAVLFGLTLTFSNAWAHGGAAGTDTDQCKIQIQGEWVHFTAYQPMVAPGDEFCENIPELNSPTNLVFDYIGVKLRKLKVEFEITKEPEGKRVYYQEPYQHKSGTVNAKMKFEEAGDYLVHVSLTPEQGDKVDAHIAFSVGGGRQMSLATKGIILLFVFGGLYFLYLSNAAFKAKADEFLKKLKT